MQDSSGLPDETGRERKGELAFLADALGGQIISTDDGPVIEISSALFAEEWHGIFSTRKLPQLQFNMLPFLFGNMEDEIAEAGRVVFIDTETTGLSGGAGTMAFLIGLGYLNENEFIIKQYFCPDFDCESAMLNHFHMTIDPFSCLISYNGKCFDIPLLENRSVLNRIKPKTTAKKHLDLLAPARRLYKASCGDCSLASLENSILGFHRPNDIPGGLIPQAYFDFLRNRNPSVIKLVLSHNRFDILSLAGLFFHSCSLSASQSKSAEDLCSLGLIYFKSGCYGKAEDCLVRAIKFGPGSLSYFKAAWHLYILLRRDFRWQEAFALCSEALENNGDFLIFGIEAAKIAEHKFKDFPTALRLTDLALRRAVSHTDRSGMHNCATQSIIHRKNRLLKKLSAVK